MAISFINATNQRLAAATSNTVTIPASTAASDVCLAFIWWTTAPGTVTIPGGWSQYQAYNDGTRYINIYYRVLAGGDSNVSFSWVNSVNTRNCVRDYRGVDTLSPFDSAAQNAAVFTTTGATIDPATITTTCDAEMLVWFGAWSSTATMTTAPSSYVNVNNDSGANPSHWSGDLAQARFGASGSNSGTLSATPNKGVVVLGLRGPQSTASKLIIPQAVNRAAVI